MVVFTLEGFPYVFKIARDKPSESAAADYNFLGKETAMKKYREVSELDRVGWPDRAIRPQSSENTRRRDIERHDERRSRDGVLERTGQRFVT